MAAAVTVTFCVGAIIVLGALGVLAAPLTGGVSLMLTGLLIAELVVVATSTKFWLVESEKNKIATLTQEAYDTINHEFPKKTKEDLEAEKSKLEKELKGHTAVNKVVGKKPSSWLDSVRGCLTKIGNTLGITTNKTPSSGIVQQSNPDERPGEHHGKYWTPGFSKAS